VGPQCSSSARNKRDGRFSGLQPDKCLVTFPWSAKPCPPNRALCFGCTSGRAWLQIIVSAASKVSRSETSRKHRKGHASYPHCHQQMRGQLWWFYDVTTVLIHEEMSSLLIHQTRTLATPTGDRPWIYNRYVLVRLSTAEVSCNLWWRHHECQ
jgi:hypothetical protein